MIQFINSVFDFIQAMNSTSVFFSHTNVFAFINFRITSSFFSFFLFFSKLFTRNVIMFSREISFRANSRKKSRGGVCEKKKSRNENDGTFRKKFQKKSRGEAREGKKSNVQISMTDQMKKRK